LRTIGEDDDLHVIGNNNLCESGGGTLHVIGGGDGLRMIGSDDALTVDGSSSTLSAYRSSGHHAKGLVLAPRRIWVRFRSLCPIIGDRGRCTLVL
jgi:hypothetical protein